MIVSRLNSYAYGARAMVCAGLFLLSNCSGEDPSRAIDIAQLEELDKIVGLDPGQRERVAAMAADWPTEPAYAVSFNALDPSLSSAQELGGSLFDSSDPHWGLPDDEGRDLVEAYCGACHSLSLVMQQSMVDSAWESTLERMVSDRGMPEIPAESHQAVISYLTEYFGAEV
jgi:hypothetical protein